MTDTRKITTSDTDDTIAATKASLTRKYTIALSLIGLLSLVAFFLLSALIETQKSAGAVVNASGRRRFTSQRIVLFSSVLVNARSEAERQAARLGLQKSADLLEKNHLGLVRGDKELKLTGENSDEVKALYFANPTQLNTRILSFIDAARQLGSVQDSELNQDNQYYRYIIEQGPANLIKDLEASVNLYQKESEADVAFLHQIETLILAATLLLLFGEGLIIFRPMTRKVIRSMRDVQDASAEVKRRSATIQTIYDNVQSGFLLVNQDLKITEGFSRSCLDLLGAGVKAGEPLPHFLGLTAAQSENFRACTDEVFADIMPEHVTLDQTPKNFLISDKSLRLVGSVIRGEHGAVSAIMFTISDITAQVAAEERNHFYETLVMILQQKDAFMNYLIDMKQSFRTCRDAMETGSSNQVRLLLHTMKGNSSVFGLTKVANLIHTLESKEAFGFSELRDLSEIEREFKAFVSGNSSILQVSYEEDMQRNYLVASTHLKNLHDKIQSSVAVEALRADILGWIFDIKKTPFDSTLRSLNKTVDGLAKRLDKEVIVETFGEHVLIDAEYLQPVMQNFVHIVRNAVDHGIEAAGQRHGKPDAATIRLGVEETSDGAWCFTIADDGRGINTERLVEKAVSRGAIDAASAKKLSLRDRLNLVFADGISTADVVTEISGRGVGMSAALAAVKVLGGSIDISSESGRGTSFYIRIPKPAAAPSDIRKAA